MAFSFAGKKSEKTGDERKYSSVCISPDSFSCELERVMVIYHHTVQHENIISITDHRRSSVMWNDSHEKVSRQLRRYREDVMHLVGS